MNDPRARAKGPPTRANSNLGAMAQLVAHLLCKQGVRGSSPLGSTLCSSGSCLTIGFRDQLDSFGTRFRFLRDSRSGRCLTLFRRASGCCAAWLVGSSVVVIDCRRSG